MYYSSLYNSNIKLTWFFTFGDYTNLKKIKADVLRPYNVDFDMSEIRYNTARLYDNSYNLYYSLVKYCAGDCWFNEKKSQGKILLGNDRKMYNNIIDSIKLVKPISYSINLYHGFEWFLTYPNFIKDTIIDFNYCLSKTPSYHVASFFAQQSNKHFQRYMYVKYPAGTKHLCPDFRREFYDEYEYLSVNEKLKFVDTVYQISLWPWPSISIFYVFIYIGINI
jgi:hypothetical protein